MSRLDRLRRGLSHAFAVEDQVEFSDQERALVDRLADFVVRRRMTAPALMALESARPLNFIGSQVLAFFGPLLSLVFPPEDCDRFVQLLEKRQCVDLVIETITQRENELRG